MPTKLVSAAVSAAGVASNVHEGPVEVKHPEEGVYLVKFGNLLGTPVVVANYQGAGNNGLGVIPSEATAEGFRVEVRNTLNKNADLAWEFFAVGSAVATGSAKLTAKALLKALAPTPRHGLAKLKASALLRAVGRRDKLGKAALRAKTTLRALAARDKLGRAALHVKTALRAAGAKDKLGRAALRAITTLRATGRRDKLGRALLRAFATLAARGEEPAPAAISQHFLLEGEAGYERRPES